jgi:2-haloacid dehalogenase
MGEAMDNFGRRDFLQRGTLVAGTTFLAGTGLLLARPAGAQVSVQGSRKYGVKALLFDMFGTVLDMWTTLPREAEKILKPRGINLDWQAFGRAWLGEYGPSIVPVREGKIPFVPLDTLFRQNLERVLPRFGVKDLPNDVLEQLHLVWHRLDGWPDVASGMVALGKNFLLAPCSNGNIAMMADIARHNNIRFDAILGAEIARTYKPAPKVYTMSCEAFGLKNSECMMIGAAGHTGDFEGAAMTGMKTGAVARPNEGGLGKGTTVPKFKVDIAASDLNDLAAKLMA